MRSFLFFCLVLVSLTTSTSCTSEIDPDSVHNQTRLTEIIENIRSQSGPGESSSVISLGREALGIAEGQSFPILEAEIRYLMAKSFDTINSSDSALAYARQASAILEKYSSESSEKLTADTQFLIGQILHNRSDFSGAISSFVQAREFYNHIGSARDSYRAIHEMAIAYKDKGEYQQSLELHLEALEGFEAIADTHSTGSAYNGLGIVYANMGDYDRALDYFHRSLEIKELIGHKPDIGGSLANMGGIYDYLDRYENALSYYHRAAEIFEEIDDRRKMASILYNIAGIYQAQEKYQQSQETYARALELAEETGNRHLVAYIEYGKARILEEQDHFEAAREAYRKTVSAFENIGDKRGIATLLLALGRLGEDEEAVKDNHRGIELSEEIGTKVFARDGYLRLSEIYESTGRYQEALEAYRQFRVLQDSLDNIESRSKIEELETQYQTREQQQQISLLEQDQEIQRLWIYGLIGGVLFMGSVSGLLFNRSRLRRKALDAQKRMHEAEAEQTRLRTEAAEALANYLQSENERKSLELNQARDLQLSMLPKKLPDHPKLELAVFMETATEVGGDYYDFNLSEDGSLTFAIGDATGHGLQASTLVTAVKSLFSNFVDEEDLVTILHKSDQALQKMNLPKLFMALALGRFRKNELEIVGAGMPPALLLRSGTQSLEKIQLKGMPIGSPARFPYRMNRYKLNSGDLLVFMSDGLTELKNSTGMMIEESTIHNVILGHAHSNPEQIIGAFKTVIAGWLLEAQQNDDISIIVIKVR